MNDGDAKGRSRTAASLLAQTRTRRWIAAALLIVALVLRVAAVEHYHYRPVDDSRSYLSLSGQIADSGDYWSTDGGAGGSRGPTAYFPPGFPYFVAMVGAVDGQTSKSKLNIHLVRLEQAVLGTVTVALIGLVALELFGSATALIALGLAAVYPVLIELSTVIVAENLLVALELAAVYAALRARSAQRPTHWVVACGVFTGLAALTHENGLLLVIPMAIAMWSLKGASRAPGRRRTRRWSAPLLLVLVTCLTIAPWMIRDAVLLHAFVPISDEGGITLIGTYNATAAHETDPPFRWRFYGAVPSVRRKFLDAGSMTEPQFSSHIENVALQYIGHHPLTPLKVAFDNTLRLLELEGKRAQVLSEAAIGLKYGEARLGVYSFWLLLILAIAGLFTRAIRSVPWWVWLVPLLMWLSVVAINAETPRFREPLEPFLIMSAACALTALARRFSAARVRQPARDGVSARPTRAGGPVRPAESDPAPS
jgi:4-amino-4-deoxy-L-arabinose transferase-like glycosyltransferase